MPEKHPIEAWRERLTALQVAEASASNAAQKFEIAQQIAEARAKIAEFERAAPAASNPPPPQFAPSKLLRGVNTGSDLLIGRDQELADLDAAWAGATRKNIVTIVAWGGVGKTSLVGYWADRKLAQADKGGIERYIDWSFYSQGTRRDGDATGADKAASADLFIKSALEFFGDPALAGSNTVAWQKGERLAQLVAGHRSLLILDGLEPLQDARTGELRDDALRSLLRGLATHNPGLCLVTTRQQLPELDRWHTLTAPEWKLSRLSKTAGAKLLAELGVHGTQTEREKLAEDVKGHALTLSLLGKYLAHAHDGDIRRRDLVSLREADFEETRGHAFNVMEAYETWFEKNGRVVELAILRLLGLFDRPATPDCLKALRTPAVPGLTDVLAPLNDAQWNRTVNRLVELGLVEKQDWEPRRILGYSEEESEQWERGEPKPFKMVDSPPGTSYSLDAHPLIREFFAARLREKAGDAWRAAHERLFEHLRFSVPYWPEGLDGLQPLYQAVAHGCQAGLYEKTCSEVYRDRINRGTSGRDAFYSVWKLGTLGAELAAEGCFFVSPWTKPSPDLTETYAAWLLNSAGYLLRAIGRLSEAREPMRESMDRSIQQQNWKLAATSACNLSELELTLGHVTSAMYAAEQCVDFADRSGDAFLRIVSHTGLAAALHQAGEVVKSQSQFEEAEAMQKVWQPEYGLLYSLRGFQFCDLLLTAIECAAWCEWNATLVPFRSQNAEPTEGHRELTSVLSSCQAIEQRALQTLEWGLGKLGLLDIALDHLTLGRVAVYRLMLRRSPFDSRDLESSSRVDTAVHGLRRAGMLDYLPRGLLTLAWMRAVQCHMEEARAALDEAQSIAERGPMPLYLADVHLHRARLFRDRDELGMARALIEKHGYGRRLGELEDAEDAARSW